MKSSGICLITNSAFVGTNSAFVKNLSDQAESVLQGGKDP